MSNRGQVFVFNLAGEDLMMLSLNGGPAIAESLPGWPAPGQPVVPFAANAIAVPRVLNASDGFGKFYSGSNEVIIQWSENPHTFHIDLTDQHEKFPLPASFVLCVSFQAYLFMDQFGALVYGGPIALS
jgi:hypothetical protein